ncbi:hypothetical protein FRC08_015921 [Ceratobasidium sp. 394]|nr:hypothetical protein FRC08_015921 [Ceratobasidium sp. 394]
MSHSAAAIGNRIATCRRLTDLPKALLLENLSATTTMASQHPSGGSKRIRHRIQEIKLEPSSPNYDISIELLVDGKQVHKLPAIKKGQPLCWGNLSLPCDVHETSTIAIVIIEVHTVRDKRESTTYQIAQVMGQDTLSAGCAGGRYTATVEILCGERVERAYQEAFARTQRMEMKPSVVERTGRVGAAFKALLALGNMMADLDPTGGAKVAFAVCTKAWEVCIHDGALGQLDL